MSGTRRKYAGILISPDYFIRGFNEEIKDLLRDYQDVLYIPTTYRAMVRQTENRFLTDSGKGRANSGEVFRGNKKVLDVYQLKERRSKETENGHILALARDMAKEGEATGIRYLLLTSDYTLIQLVVFNRLEIDLYDVVSQKWIPVETFPKLHDDWRFDWEPPKNRFRSNTTLKTADTTQKHLTLYDDAGNAYHLRAKQGGNNGTEARLYTCDKEPEYIAKVFKDLDDERTTLTPSKVENIKLLKNTGESVRCPWLILPKKLLYLEPNGAYPVAFFMDNIQDFRSLDEVNAFHDYHSDQKVFVVLQIVRDLIWQICFLAAYNLRPIDFNMDNFGLSKKSHGVVMLDTDSFCSRAHLAMVRTQAFPGPDRFKFGSTSIETSVRQCVRMAYLYLAWLLMRKQAALYVDGMINQHTRETAMYRIPQKVRDPLMSALTCELDEMPYYDEILTQLDDVCADPYYQECTYEDLERKDHYDVSIKQEPGWSARKAYSGPKQAKAPAPKEQPVDSVLFIPEDAFAPTAQMLRGGKRVHVSHPEPQPKKSKQLVEVPYRKPYRIPKHPEEQNAELKKKERSARRRNLCITLLVVALFLAFGVILFADLGWLVELRDQLTDLRATAVAWWDSIRQRFGPGSASVRSMLQWLRALCM